MSAAAATAVTPRRGGWRALALVLGAWVAAAVPPTPARATPVDELSVQAAYVLNFVRYSRWPPQDTGPFVIAVLGTADDASAFRELAQRAAPVQGRKVVVKLLPLASIARDGKEAVRALSDAAGHAEVLYVGTSHDSWAEAASAVAVGKPMLTVGTTRHFLERGGMFALYLDAGHVRFAVNAPVIRTSPVDVSARLLMLARPMGPG